jgi:uncharacterized membrane protein YqjE
MDGLKEGIKGLIVLLGIALPLAILGIWKLVEVIMWAVTHIKIV